MRCSVVRTFLTWAFATSLPLIAAAQLRAADLYDAAVQHPGRSADDLKRDPLDHPAEVLRLAGIKPGMQVADFLAGDGYYSELVSYIVGAQGHVSLINDQGFDGFTNNAWQKRLAGNRLPNVEHVRVDLSHLTLAPDSLDAVLLIKVYHDLYWVNDDKKEWPDVNVGPDLDTIVRALKPGGTLLLVDHSAKPGSGSSAASTLHRIDEAFARKDFESRGLKVVATSNLLRRPDDPRTQISYKAPALGKTDRFVMVFRKGT